MARLIIVGDSAYPLTTYPTSWDGVAVGGYGFYIGGNTPHTWSEAEIATLKRRYRYLLPIYTCSNPGSRDVASDAADAIACLRELGVPAGVALQLDYETAVGSAYEQAFDTALRGAGYKLLLYGSAATVTKNARPSDGYNEAAWTGHAYAPSDTADQFVDTGTFDLNEFGSATSLWDTRPATTTTPAAGAAASEEEEMSTQAEAGYATITWSTGTRHVVQVAYDSIGGNAPVLRVVLLLESGPLVLAESWKPTAAGRVLEFVEHQAAAYGVELQPVGAAARYAATVS
jgi:hypothetical protein